MKNFCLAVLLCLSTISLVRAELSPSAYEAMQAKAPEHLQIQVLRVDVSPTQEANTQSIAIVAQVDEVVRGTGSVKAGDIINITYTVTERPRGWAGPGEVSIPQEQAKVVAYLAKAEGGDYAPAAGRMTFSNF